MSGDRLGGPRDLYRDRSGTHGYDDGLFPRKDGIRVGYLVFERGPKRLLRAFGAVEHRARGPFDLAVRRHFANGLALVRERPREVFGGARAFRIIDDEVGVAQRRAVSVRYDELKLRFLPGINERRSDDLDADARRR